MGELDRSFELLSVTALRVKHERDALLDAAVEVRDMLDGYIDVVDGDHGIPAPNKAMRAAALLDAVIAMATAHPILSAQAVEAAGERNAPLHEANLDSYSQRNS